MSTNPNTSSAASAETDLTGSDLLHRPPYNSRKPGPVEPLFVTPTLVFRSDNTPQSARPKDSGSTRATTGQSLENPDQQPQHIAVESDPNKAWEHWDEYWRKIHGPKFAYDEPGSSSQLVLRYDQLHRLASGPSSFFRPPYRAMTDAAGHLVEDPYARVPEYGRPRWDGLAYIAYASEDAITKTLEQEKFAKRIVADEQVAFRKISRQLAREHILIPSARHRDPISLVKIHIRQPTLSREDFQHRWLHEQASLVLSAPSTHTYVRRYALLPTIGVTQPDPVGAQIDGLSVLAFGSLNDVEDYLITSDYARIEQHEAQLCDPNHSEFWTAINYSVINRLPPEAPTSL